MYNSADFEYTCPDIFREISRVSREGERIRTQHIDIIWNAAATWCVQNGVELVQPQFVTMGNKTWIYIIYKEKFVD